MQEPRPVPGLDIFARRKREGQPLVVLTAYDLTSALIGRDGGADALLVGDSLGMVMLGHETTLPVTLDDMVHHCRAVQRARTGLPVIADLPYGAFHVDATETARAGLRLVKEAGVHAVKLEGGRQRAGAIAALLDAEIPVMGHLGLTPQSVNRFGGYRVQGRGAAAQARLLDDAAFLAGAGCFAIVLECVPAALAARVTAAVGVPTIGIGAGPGCDGQVLVFHDLLGLLPGPAPRFVKRYADLGRQAAAAVSAFAAEVRQRRFPGAEHSYADGEPAAAGDEPGDAGAGMAPGPDVTGGSAAGGSAAGGTAQG
ncbi:3-methyl-2-oxobutanoate hydroxymethyltransferase [bacterium]|nr:3-methyl-2-oxobutanoate hydroxymethyltransferase [bacterium]